ncbi:MAG: hypothetical protein ACTHMB_19745, partial [Candidatus Binatia bacterium]
MVEAKRFTTDSAILLRLSPPNVFIGGLGWTRLDCRLNHAGMTAVVDEICWLRGIGHENGKHVQ